MALSKEQRAAISRANGAKSRGPKTPEGKAITSKNALKTGLTAKKFLLPELESEQEFDKFSVMIRRHYKPRNAPEAICVDRIILVLWKIRRLNLEMALRTNEFNEKHSFVSSSYIGKIEDYEKFITVEEKLSRQHEQLTKEFVRLRQQPIDSNIKALVMA